MKKFLFISACITAALTLAACSKDDGATSLEKIQKKLLGLDSYSATVSILQTSNKGEKNYEVNQEAKKSGEYRMVVTAPEKIAGTVTVFNGTSTFQYNPRVDGSLSIDMPASQLRNEILLTSFIKNYIETEGQAAETTKTDEGISTVLEAKIPGDNPYMTHERLFIDNETQLPIKLIIYDEKNSERIVVTYKKIEYNTKLSDEIFAVPETSNAESSKADENAENTENTEQKEEEAAE